MRPSGLYPGVEVEGCQPLQQGREAFRIFAILLLDIAESKVGMSGNDENPLVVDHPRHVKIREAGPMENFVNKHLDLGEKREDGANAKEERIQKMRIATIAALSNIIKTGDASMRYRIRVKEGETLRHLK